jgi:hypothetical protein
MANLGIYSTGDEKQPTGRTEGAQIVRETRENKQSLPLDANGNEVYGGDYSDAPVEACSTATHNIMEIVLKGNGSSEKKMERAKVLEGVKFANEIKVDFIRSVDYRILCRFLGVTGVDDVKNYPYTETPLISLILMQSLDAFMEKQGFSCVGELNFDQHGDSIPVVKTVWRIKNKELPFTSTGFKYYSKTNKGKEQNIVFYLWADLDAGRSCITCFSRNEKKSEKIIVNLGEYSKKNNCLRGAKLKDIDIFGGSFSELEISDKYCWENYYYSDEVEKLFDLEVFSFMKNVKRYNKEGINKRGILTFGKPGTGKTTIGYIVCNEIPDHTVIWITPEIISENSHRTLTSIKLLYKLADFVSPCVLLLEDLDLFAQSRDRSGGDLRLGALMNILDGVNSIENAITIGTTNRLDTIENALRNRPGRFDRVVEISSLDAELRFKMFENRLQDWNPSRSVLDYIVSNTSGWTGAESQEFINTLNLNHICGKKKSKKISVKTVDHVIETMNKFGIGEKSGVFGFKKDD